MVRSTIPAALVTTVLGISTLASADRMPDAGRPPEVEVLDRAAIAAGMASAKPKITACGDVHKATVKVKLSVVVAPDGRVTKATTDRSAKDSLGHCLVTAMKSAVFKKTQKGGRFTYPLVFSAPVTEPPVNAPAPGATVDTFDRAAISTGIATVKTKIAACGTKTKATGTVKMRVVVGANGKVTSATPDESSDATLGACVASVMKTVTFKKTPSGGSFSYPFVFGSPTPPPATTGPMPVPTPADDPVNAGLDRSMITAGIAKVKAKIAACGTGANASAKGTVKIKVDVAPAGTVTTASVVSAPSHALGACVAGVLKAATFAKTAQGGTFSYPFVF